MNNQYTSLELSKKIQKAVPSVETEMWWVEDLRRSNNSSKRARVQPSYKFKNGFFSSSLIFVSAYSFTDLLKVIQVLGEESGLPHKLLDAYLADNLTIGKHTEDFITNLLEQ